MAITPQVSPTTREPTHDLKLTDLAGNSLGLILVNSKGEPDKTAIQKFPIPRQVTKMNTGASSGYESLEAPYTPIVQSDWSGGRGSEEFERDTTRYYDGNAADSTRGDVILGPKVTNSTGINQTYEWEASGGYVAMPSPFSTLASRFTTVGSITIRSVEFWVWALPIYPAPNLRISIYSDDGGAPDAELGYDTVTVTGSGKVSADITLALSATTDYWIVVASDELIPANYVYLKATTKADYDILQGTSGWPVYKADTSVSLTFNISSIYGDCHFFNYKGAQYFISSPDDPTVAPSLYMNGYRGVATSNTADKSLLNTTLDLSGLDLAGKIAYITGGKGSTERKPWRVIESNTTTGTDDAITVTEDWIIEHDATTEYVILGCDSWQAITGHGMTTQVTDVAVVDDTVYVAQGPDVNIRRMNWYNNSGTWTARYDADGTNRADFLLLCPATDGSYKIWKALAKSCVVSYATKVAWGNNLTYTDVASGAPCGISGSRITNLVKYGNPALPYVMKEDSFGSISGDTPVYAEVPLYELATLADYRNGSTAMQKDVYLYFSLLEGVERYYDQRLDDIGMNKDVGLPAGRKGTVTDLVAYAGGYYACVNGGTEGYSSIWKNNGVGWCELYRADLGQRIRKLSVQVIPNQDCQRMWFSLENLCSWIPISSNPYKSADYRFTTHGEIITPWMYGGLKDVVKYWRSATLFSENLNFVPSAYRSITLQFQTDNGTDSGTWYPDTPLRFWISPVETDDLSTEYATNLYNISGRRIRFKIRLESESDTTTPRLIALVVNPVTRVPPKMGWAFTFKVQDYPVDGIGDVEWTGLVGGSELDKTVSNLNTILEEWANSETEPCPLTLASNLTVFNNKKVFMEPASFKPIRVVYQSLADGTRRATMIGSMTLIEA